MDFFTEIFYLKKIIIIANKNNFTSKQLREQNFCDFIVKSIPNAEAPHCIANI